MSGSILVDDLDNATSGFGQTVDIQSQLGYPTGSAISQTIHGGVVGDSAVTAGAVALQLGTAGASGITWATAGTPVTIVAGGGATIPAVTLLGATHVRTVVTTAVGGGGKATAVITK